MDERLNALWKEGKYPFNQPIIILDDMIEVSELLVCLKKVGNYLSRSFPNVTINLNYDWHEHDNYINESAQITWKDYIKNLENVNSLYDSRHGDTYVRNTIYPESLEFILRYYILEEDEDDEYPGIWGIFDLTIDKTHFKNIVSLIEGTGAKYKVSDSKEFFDRSYAG